MENTVVVEETEEVVSVEDEMDALDVLLGASHKRQTDTYDIPKREGLPATLHLKLGSLDDRKFEELSKQSERPVGNREARRTQGVTTEQDTPYFMRLVVAEGVVYPNLSDPKLLAHHGVRTADALIRKLLLPGEITKCAEVIMDLSGYHDNSVVKAKN